MLLCAESHVAWDLKRNPGGTFRRMSLFSTSIFTFLKIDYPAAEMGSRKKMSELFVNIK